MPLFWGRGPAFVVKSKNKTTGEEKISKKPADFGSNSTKLPQF